MKRISKQTLAWLTLAAVLTSSVSLPAAAAEVSETVETSANSAKQADEAIASPEDELVVIDYVDEPYVAVNETITCSASSDGKTLTISGTGDMDDLASLGSSSPWSTYRSTATKIVIEDGITHIGNYSFAGFSNLAEVVIPATVTSIGDHSFDACGSLSKVTINGKNISFGNYSFANCTSLASIAFPSGTTSIGEYAFNNCGNLTTVTIPGSVGGNLMKGAFNGCGKIESATINEGVTQLPESCFAACVLLKTLKLPATSLSKIGDKAFMGCSSLNTINNENPGVLVVPDSVTSIGASAFSKCGELISVSLSDTVGAIGDSAFEGCKKLTKAIIGNVKEEEPTNKITIGQSAFFECDNLESVQLNSAVTSIGNMAFRDTGITAIALPNSLESIGDEAFARTPLTTVTIPGSVKTIGQRAFILCEDLGIVKLEEGVTEIRSFAFAGCTSLTEVNIPATETDMGEGAFAGCSSLSKVTIEDGALAIGSYAFSSKKVTITNGKISTAPHTVKLNNTTANIALNECTGLKEISIPASVTKMGETITVNATSGAVTYSTPGYAFAYAAALEKVTLAGTNTGASTFAGCTSLKTVSLGDSLETIGENAFINCTSLGSITLPDSLIRINKYGFAGCVSLGAITFPDSYFQSLGDCAFSSCTSIKSVYIPDSVKTLGSGTFAYCTALKSARISENISVTAIPTSFFEGCTLLETVSCANITTIFASAFKDCASFANADSVIKPSVKTIYQNAFEGCSKLNNVTIPEGVTAISNYTFKDCTSLSVIEIEGAIKTIGTSAFENCTSLPGITFASDTTTIGNSAFKGCTSMTSASFPATTITISPSAFANCSALETVVVDNANSIGDYAFQNCEKLQYIIPDGVTRIGQYAFDGCAALDTPLPTGIANNANLGQYAFRNCTSLGKSRSIVLPTAITTVPVGLFSGCSSLPNVVIHDGVTTISQNAFMGCTSENFNTVELPKTTINIGASAYQGCTNLKLVYLHADKDTHMSATSDFPATIVIGTKAFMDCNLMSTFSISAENPTNVGANAFENCASLESITLYLGGACNTTTGIPAAANMGIGAFKGCSSLRSVTLTGAYNSISSNTFQDCVSLEAAGFTTLSNYKLTALGDYAFDGCKKMKEVPSLVGISTIGTGCFRGCESLQSVIIPNTVTALKADTFNGCTNLEGVVFLGNPNVSGDTKGTACANCPKVKLFSYETATNIKTYAEKFGYKWSALAGSGENYIAVIKSPTSVSRVNGVTTFSVRAIGAPGSTISYQWYFKNPGATTFTKADGATSDTYARKIEGKTDGIKVYCEITCTPNEGDPFSVKTDEAVATTKNSDILSVDVNGTKAVITWNEVPGATSYTVCYYVDGTENVAAENLTATTYNFIGIDKGKTYGFLVKHYFGDTVGAFSDADIFYVSSGVPENVKAEAGPGKVTVSWDALLGAEMYRVFMVDGTTYTRVFSGDSNTTSAEITGLTSGKAYKFVVCAKVGGVWGDYSAAVTATPFAAKPTITGYKVGDNQVKLEWTALDGAEMYRVYTYADGVYTRQFTCEGTRNIATVTGLDAGKEYGFVVSAKIDGAWTDYSDKADLVYATPTGVAKPSIVGYKVGNYKVKLEWKAVEGAEMYRVYTYENGVYTRKFTCAGARNIATVTGLVSGTNYGFVVSAKVNGVWTDYANTADLVYATPTGDPAPVITGYTTGDGKVKLAWYALEGAEMYRVYSLLDGVYTRQFTTYTSTTATVTGLENGTEYGFVVSAKVDGVWTDYNVPELILYATPTA